MCFDKRLNRYIEQIGCTAKQLAEVSGVSSAAISRYRTGGRTPDSSGKQIAQLAKGIAALSDGAFDESEVLESLAMSISGISVSHATFLANLNALVDAVGMRRTVFARELNFDASYISRIFSGQRRPSNMSTFIAGVSAAMARRLEDDSDSESLALLTGVDWCAIEDVEERAKAIAKWLSTNRRAPCDPVELFLEHIAEFDLNDYLRLFDFEADGEPIAPARVPSSHTYLGYGQIMQAELDFLKAALFSKSNDDLIMYSDMPMKQLAWDLEFAREWMISMARLLKKGVRIFVIDDMDRPLPETMLRFEAWIPLYMTGNVYPYYYDSASSSVFNHLLRISGDVAMVGDGIVGRDDSMRFILTRAHDKVAYYRKRAEYMLELAKPLLRVITEQDRDVLDELSDYDARSGGDFRMIMGTLPIATMPMELLETMLNRYGITGEKRNAILAYKAARTQQFEAVIANGALTLEVPAIDVEEFEQHPVFVELAGMFFDRELAYTYEEYVAHLDALEKVMQRYDNVVLVKDRSSAFRNIFIGVHIGRNVLISKNKVPAIHYVIEQPDMVTAFEQFMPVAGKRSF